MRRGPAVAALVTGLLVLSACGAPPQPQPSAPRTLSPGAPTGWLTYHKDLARTGFERDGPDPGSVRRLWSRDLDGPVFAEPLVLGDRVLVATQGNSVYALNADTGAIVWRTNVGTPVPGSQLPCGNVNPVGITGTPVVDPATGLLYAAAFVSPGRHELVALEVATGRIRFRQAVDPPGTNPLVQNQRAALALSRERVYVAFGGRFGDCGAYHGWVVGVPAPGGAPIFYRVPTEGRGGIWAPPGPTIDAQGNLLVASGNSTGAAAFDRGDSVIKLSPDLKELDFFAPRDWARLNREDLDLGSTSPALLDGGLLFQIGKSGTGYLLRAERLGGIGGQVFEGRVCAAAFGGTAYAAPLLYVPCSDGLRALRVDPRPSFTVAWQGPRFRGESPPIVAGSTVWAIDNRAGKLYGLDAATGQVRFQDTLGRAEHFATPTVAGGRLFVPGDRRVIAYAS